MIADTNTQAPPTAGTGRPPGRHAMTHPSSDAAPSKRTRGRQRVPGSAVDALIDLRLRELGKEEISIAALEREHGMRAGLLAYALRKENRGRVPTAASVNAWATALECEPKRVSRAFAQDYIGEDNDLTPAQQRMLVIMEGLSESAQRALVRQAEALSELLNSEPDHGLPPQG
jgi:hypothetical protein